MLQYAKDTGKGLINYSIFIMKAQFAALGVLLIAKVAIDWSNSKSDQMGFLDAVKAALSHAFSFGKMIVTKLPDLSSKLGSAAYDGLEKVPVLVDKVNAAVYDAYKFGYEKIAYLGSKAQDVTCSITSTVDEVVNLSPCLYKVSQTKDYAAAHDFKALSTSLVHVAVTSGLNLVLPKTTATKYTIIGLNVAAGWLESNILNSVVGLQTVDAASKLGQFGYYLLEGGVLFSGIGINHNSYVKQHPGTPKYLVDSYQMMKTDAFAQNCTDADQYHFALHEYICPISSEAS